MKKASFFSVLLLLLLPLYALAQSSLAGNWIMEVQTPDGTMKVKLTIADDGNYEVDLGANGQIDVKGKYETDGDTITVQDVSGDGACLGDQKGVYKFTVDAEIFSLTRVEDPCEGRGGPDGQMKFKRM
jgi:hypothetical protein